MDVKIRLHPLFIIFAFSLIFFGWFNILFTYFLVMILHEFGHYFVAKILGYKLNKIVFMPYGVSLNGQGNIIKKRDEFLIAIAGPLVNFVLVILCVALWWIFPICYSYTLDFVACNLCLGLFNLMPVFPLDGGRMFVAVLSSKIKKYKVIKIMKIVSGLFSGLFLILFFLSVFTKLNFTYFFIAVFLFSSALDGKNNYIYERSYLFNKDCLSGAVEIKTYVVNKKMPLINLTKYISGNYFVNFYIVDDNMKLLKVISENEVLNLITKNN